LRIANPDYIDYFLFLTGHEVTGGGSRLLPPCFPEEGK